MLSRLPILSALSVLTLVACARAQQNTTIQLPTFNFTTASTTATVPDGGTGLLGGIMRASEGSVTRGVPMLSKIPYVNRLFKNRGIGRDVSSWNQTVVPRIIILEEEEFFQTGISPEMLSGMGRGGAGGGFGGGFGGAVDPEVARKAEFITRNIARRELDTRAGSSDPRLPSVDEIRHQNDLAKAQRESEAAEFFAKGQKAEAEGKQSVATIYYEMALRRAEGELRRSIAARLAVLAGAEQQERKFTDR
jgi:hypothetical protein